SGNGRCSIESLPVSYNGRDFGRVELGLNSKLETRNSKLCVSAISGVLTHLLDREMAIADLAEAMVTGYEELNVLYRLLPTLATRATERKVGEVLVQQAAQTLHCDRVSLLVYDESRK